MENNCRVEGCMRLIDRPKYGWCEMHHARWRRNGDPKITNRASINEDFFFEWTPELAWVLGLLWSDGNIYKNGINLVSKDLQLIAQVADLIEYSKDPYLYDKRYHRIRFSSTSVAAKLRELGLKEAKSYDCPWPTELYYEDHFIRGLIDGDGWVSLIPRKYSLGLAVGICGAAAPIKKGVEDYFERHALNYSLSEYKNAWNTKMWKFTINKSDSLEKLYALLYDNEDVPCLLRKKKNFDKWINRDISVLGAPRIYSDEDIAEAAIRIRNGDLYLSQLQKEFGMSEETLRVRLLEKGINVYELLPHTKKGRNHFNAKYSKSDIENVRKLYKSGKSMREIARTTGISRATVKKYIITEDA